MDMEQSVKIWVDNIVLVKKVFTTMVSHLILKYGMVHLISGGFGKGGNLIIIFFLGGGGLGCIYFLWDKKLFCLFLHNNYLNNQIK